MRGICHVAFVYDIAFSIDLSEAERITAVRHRGAIKHRRRAPTYIQYQPAPLRINQDGESLTIGPLRTNTVVELVLYDFGAVSVLYRIPFDVPVSDLLAVSDQLYENSIFLKDSRSHVEHILELLRRAVSKPNIAPFVEDYVIFHIESVEGHSIVQDFVTENRQVLAQTLRAETRELSQDEVKDAISHCISFSDNDVAIIDWNAAILVGPDTDDALAVLEFANVDLLEMRYLDRRLDEALALAYETMAKERWKRFPFGSNPAELHRLAQWQVDSAILFEGVNNSLKLVGDQYLARLFRMAVERFHLPEWDASIMRKLQTLESIYTKISDQVTTRRMEALEWIIIILIAISIVLPLITSFGAH